MMIVLLNLLTVMVAGKILMYMARSGSYFHVQDESGSSSFVLFERHDQGLQNLPDEFKILLNRKFVFKVQISLFNLENNYLAYTVYKLTDDESVLAKVFKRSPAYEQQIVDDDSTSVNMTNKEKSDSVHGDNLEVVDLESLTPSPNAGKRPIDIVATTDSLELSSSKAGAGPTALKIPKMEIFE
ncbi:unnamed protein product [Lactuca virosa]|uniref:Uncharacterized protein n=1 Tax=Lactuca virosa TaxID=75947 RepID=A0AAU9MSS1_9ASTR|nr:unnamed protein product [Lactuca virosa]